MNDGYVRPWYQTITRRQWNALAAAMLGWMLDAMDFVLYLMALRTLQGVFAFDEAWGGLLATVSLLTSAAGGLAFGLVADRIGRTRALMATVVVFSFCSLGTASAQGFWQLFAWRALLGVGMGGEWASGAVLVSETWPAKHRAKAIGIMQSGWALGYLLAVALAALILGDSPTEEVLGLARWRWLFVAGVLPALFIVWVRYSVPEPDVWSARQAQPTTETNPFAVVLGRALIGRTLLATLLTASVMFAYWGLCARRGNMGNFSRVG